MNEKKAERFGSGRLEGDSENAVSEVSGEAAWLPPPANARTRGAELRRGGRNQETSPERMKLGFVESHNGVGVNLWIR